MRLAELEDKRVAIWGYGREGRAALSAFRRRFPTQPLSLICSVAEAEDARTAKDPNVTVLAKVADVDTLRGFDIVIKSPGISPYQSPVPESEAGGVRFTSGTALWFAENSECRTICVTGTKGKSTVSALIAHLLRESGKRVGLAGNIGLPLLDLLDPPQRPDWWVIELSSFQTRDFNGAPDVAVITNLYEEHLDWHKSRECYVTDKLAIAAKAKKLIVDAQPELILRTNMHIKRIVSGVNASWHVREDAIWCGEDRVLSLVDVPLPGRHNAQNVCAALAAIDAAGEDARALASHVTTFLPLPHRLQNLGRSGGVEYVNDSISTTPYATIEALRSLANRTITVLVGGFDRGVDWTPFVEYAARNPPHVIVTMGANGDAIARGLREIKDSQFALLSASTLSESVAHAKAMTLIGDIILLSPGAPSFDQFRDYAERGRDFARLAGFDDAAIGQIRGLGIA